MDESIGVIESKEECVKKSDESQYWKLKIILDGAEKPLTFSLWDYDAGTKVKTGEKVKFDYSEKPGTGFEGKPVTYRNIQSIGTLEKYEKDPFFKNKSDKELTNLAPPQSMKEKAHEEKKETGGVSSYQDRESRRQTMIVRQSALNYATQLESAFLTWEIQKESYSNIESLYEKTKKRIKATAKEFEDNVMRK